MKHFALLLVLALVLAVYSTSARAEVVQTTDFDAEGTFRCDLCQFLVGWVEEKLTSNKSKEWIIGEVGKLCRILPGWLQPECQHIVSSYVPQIVDLIMNRYPPVKICGKIGLCLAVQKLIPEVDISRMGCAQCMFFSSLAYTATNGLKDEGAISAKLNEQCASITDRTANQMCVEFINRPRVVAMLAARTPPTRMCTELGDCTLRRQDYIIGRARAYAEEHPFVPVVDGASTTECQLCQWIFSAYLSWLSDAQTEAEIALFLSQLCNFFGAYQPQCTQLVRVYVPKVIQSYVERTPPPLVCTSIGFCQFPVLS